MPLLSKEDVQSIIKTPEGPSVSIFLPTHRAGPEIQQDPIRLKNLLRQAERQLIENGTRATDARDLLAPIGALLDDAVFWRHQADGLAIFRSRELFRIYRVPLTLQEFVAVSDRFLVKPLLPLLINDARFFILALSQNAVRLLDCSRDEVHPIALPDIPQSMQESLPDGPEPQLQFHSQPVGGRNWQTHFHGHGAGADDAEAVNLTRYFQRLDGGLKGVLRDSSAPLILACVEYLAPLFREVSGYRPLMEQIISGNPDGLKDAELHEKGWRLAEQYFRHAREQATAAYQDGLSKGRAGHALKEVLTAAWQGRVATLFLPLGIHCWGRFEFETMDVTVHDAEQPGDDELLDAAAIQTLTQGGTVYSVTPDEMPSHDLLAAVYRY